MRPLVVVVVLLIIVFAGTALAADPPGGPTWYLLQDDQVLTVTFEGGTLTVAGGTPGKLLGVVGAKFRIQFERGVATSRNGEITTASGATEAAALIFLVDPAQVRAMLKQSLKTPSTATPPRGGAEPGALGALGAPITGAGVGGSRAIDVARDTTVVVDDRVNVVQRSTPTVIPAPAGRPPGPEILTPPAAGGGGGTGRAGRVITLDEHEALLAKLLGWLGEEGARCETKGYGPGWISVCTPRSAA